MVAVAALVDDVVVTFAAVPAAEAVMIMRVWVGVGGCACICECILVFVSVFECVMYL